MNKPLLTEVSIIRPLVIFLLVAYHALCPYTGGWTPPDGVEPNALYWWVGRLISGFRIETIAFVGGYVFCYQCRELGRRLPLHRFAWKKVRRLLIPSFLFGTLYYLLFRFNPAAADKQFTLDSKEPAGGYREFLMNEARYSRLTREFPDRANDLFEKNEENAKARYEHLMKLKALYE